MAEYKHTLNLPETAFPMKADLANREPARLKKWEDENLYQQIRRSRKGKKKFILHDGPPYANGDIHMGHALNKILKDIIIKSKTMQGYDSPYVPGWDCHGLPIELQVEKKLGKPNEKVSAPEFRQACRAYASEQVDKQKHAFKRLGVLGDWANSYLTMAYDYEANIVRSLAKIIDEGHLQRGFKPVHWCTDCRSALAEAEVEYQDHVSPAIDVAFHVIDTKAFLKRFNADEPLASTIIVPIWTTTPWTLPANQAVALNANLDYVLVRTENKPLPIYFCVVEDLLASTMARYQIEKYHVVATTKGKSLEELLLQHPFYDKQVPIILGDHVTTETGTGAVHTAPGHGHDDYVVGQRYHLSVESPVGPNGCFLPETPIFSQEFVFKANDHVIAVLQEKNNLLHSEKITHSYPCCWRHKTPLIFRATPQWFVSLDQQHLRESVLKAITTTEWLPTWGKDRIADMVAGRPDWCISRQRTWCMPMALIIHREKQTLHPRMTALMESIAKRIEKKGLEAWYELNLHELLGTEADQYEKVMDTLDVWFDAGVSHTCVLKKRPELQFPADVYIEGSDQYRGWFQSSVTTACAMYEKAPYRQVIMHGFTVDAEGRKMSKSLGNVISPLDIMKTEGADILRLWVASIDYHAEIVVSKEIFKRTADTYRRIRNTTRFLLANLHDFDPKAHLVPTRRMLMLDRFIVHQARELQANIEKAYNEYAFHEVYQKIHYFCSIDLGSFYLDVIKDRQYTMPKNSLARRSAQTAMYHLAHALSRWIAPILSFTADEIWEHLPGKQKMASVFMATTYKKLAALPKITKFSSAYWEKLRSVRECVNKEIEVLRAAGKLGSSLEAEVVLYADRELLKKLTALKSELRFVLITSSAVAKKISEAKADATQTEMEGLKVVVTASPATKCVRCWHRRADVGENAEHPELCARCVENVIGKGEKRHYA